MPARLLGTDEGIELIRRYAEDVDASALVGMTDPELLWLGEHRRAFEPRCRVLVQSAESLRAILSKSHQLELAGAAGLYTLPTYWVTQPHDAAAIPAFHFPVALRPDRPEDVEPGFKVKLARSPDELQALIRYCHRLRSPLLAQPFMNLPNLIVHGVRDVGGAAIATRCYLAARKFEGVSLTIEPRQFPIGLEAGCLAFAEAAGITGCWHIEFLYSAPEDRPYFLDANVRLGGTTDKVVKLGLDEPALLVQSYGIGHGAVSPGREWRGRVANKRVLLRHLFWAITGRLTAFDYPGQNRLTQIGHTCRDLLVTQDPNWDWRDPEGSLRFQFRGLTPF